MNDILPFIAFITTVTGCTVVIMLTRALVHRLRGPAPPQVDARDLEEIRAQLADLQSQIGEVTERQDFAERVLAQAREKGVLPPAGTVR